MATLVNRRKKGGKKENPRTFPFFLFPIVLPTLLTEPDRFDRFHISPGFSFPRLVARKFVVISSRLVGEFSYAGFHFGSGQADFQEYPRLFSSILIRRKGNSTRDRRFCCRKNCNGDRESSNFVREDEERYILIVFR